MTSFVSHSDCSRHDTGWKHPDHQGRLPALVRAVYRDMLTLHGHLLDVEAVPATEEQLALVHTAGHLQAVRAAVSRAAELGESVALPEGPVVSGASWDAALAAAGCALTGVDVVMRGEARNAFCCARPPGAAAGRDAPGGFSLFNNVALAVRWLGAAHRVTRVLVVEWGGAGRSAIGETLAADHAVRVATVRQGGTVPAGSAGDAYRAALADATRAALDGFAPQFVVLAAGFDALEGDPLSDLRLQPVDYHGLTRDLDELAQRCCGGRLVSVLEGGYDARQLGPAVVQHVRALAGLPAA